MGGTRREKVLRRMALLFVITPWSLVAWHRSLIWCVEMQGSHYRNARIWKVKPAASPAKSGGGKAGARTFACSGETVPGGNKGWLAVGPSALQVALRTQVRPRRPAAYDRGLERLPRGFRGPPGQLGQLCFCPLPDPACRWHGPGARHAPRLAQRGGDLHPPWDP